MLSAVYIKGFKTFARPVRMPLEGGVTAIVGPNGSGKSNVTDAVLFALGEGSPGVLRAGAMGELIFAGSESLPAANAAEVTLVFENGDGRISLPYEEVSITRRISRDGETEYRINGSRARLSDVRAVAGEAGLGRHSVLRQGSVDAIVAGGAAACRLALEEAAGLGVYRRRRLSASRRLEKADAQLGQGRQLEAELAGQLGRIQAEAAAAREYRELEARYRSLSLAHLYRVATRGLGGLRRQVEAGRARLGELAAREETLRSEEAALEGRLRDLEGRLRETERRLEGVEDGAEDLRAEALRSDRALLGLEAGRGREGDRRRLVSRLEEELRRVSRVLAELDERIGEAEAGHAGLREGADEARRALAEARGRGVEAEKERSRLAADLERTRTRLARSSAADERRVMPEDELARLRALALEAEDTPDGRYGDRIEGLKRSLGALSRRLAGLDEEVGRRRGAMAAAVGRAESRVRALFEAAPGGAGTRLYEVIRARPGYELAVEAALGEYGAGVLAADLEEGMRLLSGAERVAVRLDAEGVEKNGTQPGKPLLECVEVVDGRYADAVGRLLGGISVVERPEDAPPTNGHVAVTTGGLRLTRTGMILRSGGAFAREARLAAEQERLEALKGGPGGMLYETRGRISAAADALRPMGETAQNLSALVERASRAGADAAREVGRRAAAAERRRKDLEEREKASAVLAREERETEGALLAAEAAAGHAREEVAAAAEAFDAARSAAEESGRLLAGLRAAVSEGDDRRAKLSHRLEEVGRPIEGEAEATERVVGRVARAATTLAAAVRERRGALRGLRSGLAEEHRGTSGRRTALAREAAAVSGELAAAGAEVERSAEKVARAEAMAEEAGEEIGSEWGATLDLARREAEKNPGDTDAERQRLARRIKRFGDVNLLALSQEAALRERHEFVAAQRADAEAAAGELQRVISSVDAEIESRFSEMFGRVRAAFGEMVPRMMDGSTGVLELSEEGVEVGLRLGRKGWRPLRVLSGGERALLALSFLFAIFLSLHEEGAETFCVLDEAEAALDDLNLARFLAVVDSNRSSGQYLLVTHQKRTMAAADVLYGVVQDASGATTVVSKRMRGE